MAKFTPGPWKTGGDIPSQVWADSNGLTVAWATQAADIKRDEIIPSDEMIANARLIAHAPEMYEFIKEFINADELRGHHVLKAVELLKKIDGG